MSYFLCLSTPPQVSDETLVDAFDRRVRLMNANDTYIGKLTCGKYENWNSKIVWFGSSSFALLNRQNEIMANALDTLLQNEDCREVHFIAHLFTGSIRDEEFDLKRQKRVHPESIGAIVADVELDVRYAVARRYPWEKHE